MTFFHAFRVDLTTQTNTKLLVKDLLGSGDLEFDMLDTISRLYKLVART